MRKRVFAHPRLLFPAWLGAYAAGATGVVLALAGRLVPGVVVFVVGVLLLWLAGQWSVPFSRDAYLRRVVAVWGDWAQHVDWLGRHFDPAEPATWTARAVAATEIAVRKLKRMRRPDDLAAEHDELVSSMERCGELIERYVPGASPEAHDELVAAAADTRDRTTRIVELAR